MFNSNLRSVLITGTTNSVFLLKLIFNNLKCLKFIEREVLIPQLVISGEGEQRKGEERKNLNVNI